MEFILFYVLLTVALLFEGLGFFYGRQLAFFLILLSPFILFIFSKTKTFLLPRTITLASLVFLAFTLLSLFSSGNLQNSFEGLLFFMSCFIVFVFAYNLKDEHKKYAGYLVLALGFIFSLYSLFVESASRYFPFLKPTDEYQFVSAIIGSHNQLGDYLVLPIIVCIYLMLTRTRSKVSTIYYLLFTIFFLPYFLFSFSRSAYLSLTITSILIGIMYFGSKIERGKIIIVSFLIAILALTFSFLVIAAPVNNSNSIINTINKIFVRRNDLTPLKSASGSRIEYLKEGLSSIVWSPTGVGQGNFSYTSMKFTDKPAYWTTTSHNIFLDAFVENGVLGGLGFVVLVGIAFLKSKKNLYFFLALAMLIDFQGNYSYRFYSFFLLFWAFLGMNQIRIESAKHNFSIKKMHILLLSIALVLITVLMISGNFLLYQKKYSAAFLAYPLNQSVYPELINTAPPPQKPMLLNTYGLLFSKDPDALIFLGNEYNIPTKRGLSYSFYKRAYEVQPLSNFLVVKKIYELKMLLEGKKSAESFINSVFSKLESYNARPWVVDKYFRSDARVYCVKIYTVCPYRF